MCCGGEPGEFAPHCQKLMVVRYSRERERYEALHTKVNMHIQISINLLIRDQAVSTGNNAEI